MMLNSESQNDYGSYFHSYLQNEPLRHFGDLDYLRSQTRANKINTLIDQLKKASDPDSTFLLASKLFSQRISKEMADYNQKDRENYLFQQDFIEIFIKFYEKAFEVCSNQQEAEQRAAKILWNSIEKDQFGQVWTTLSKNREFRAKDLQLIRQFNISDNLVNIVQRNLISHRRDIDRPPYELISLNISKAIKLFQEGNYEEAIVSFDTALDIIRELEGREIEAKITTIIGSLLRQTNTTVSEGLHYLKHAQSLYESFKDNVNLAECHAEISAAYWTQGLYKETLDFLSSEIDLHAKQNNTYAVMLSEEKLSHFFRNLSRFTESERWNLRHLDSAVRAADDEMKGLYFLDANLNYAQTLIGLNSWLKAEKHISFSERALGHLDISDERKKNIILETNRMRGHISVFQGQFNRAASFFARRKEFQNQVVPASPFFSRFLRAEATFYRNLHNFSQAIKTLQPLFQSKDSLNPLNVVLLAELLALHSHETQALKLLSRAEKVFSKWNSIHALSRVYLSTGYIYFLTQDFSEARRWYQKSLEVTKSDLVDLMITIDAHLNLAYMELEKSNIKSAESHWLLAEEAAMMSGSRAHILNTQLLQANLMINKGDQTAGINSLKRIAQEAQEQEIWFIQQKANFRLNEL